MKSLRFYLPFFCLLIFSFFQGEAQSAKRIKEFKPGKVARVTVDRLGNFFLVFENGSIKKYDPNGKTLATLEAKSKSGNLPLVEPWFHPAIFLYYKSDQQVMIYDRNFESADERKLDPSIAISPSLVCPTNDNKYLVFDEADYSIKKVNPSTSQVISEFYVDTTTLKTKPVFDFLKEYQNLIFLHDRNSGISIYSNVGKKINQIFTTSMNFGFFGEELFYYQDNTIVFYDLYTEKTREIKSRDAKFVLITDERILEVKRNGKVVIFEFSDQQFPTEAR
jgi:hypothetical protein